LAEERFLVPQEESKRALRQIARDTRSSYARVAQCGRQLGDAIRHTLESDPEFRELQRQRRADPRGADMVIDDGLERGLAKVSADEFLSRYCCANSADRAKMLQSLLDVSPSGIEELIRRRVSRLSTPVRERLLGETPP